MDGRRSRIDDAVVEQKPHRRAAVGGSAGIDLRHDLFQMDVKDGVPPAGLCGHLVNPLDRNGPGGVDDRRHGLQRTRDQLVDPGEGTQIVVDRSRVEATLATLERSAVEVAADVVGVQQHEPNAGFTGGLNDRIIEFAAPIDGVMDVVELTDRGDSRVEHLLECASTDLLAPLGIQTFDEVVHRRPPGEERTGAVGIPIAEPTQSPLKGVTVGIDETRHDQRVPRRWGHRVPHLDDPIVGDLDLLVAMDGPVEKNPRGPENRGLDGLGGGHRCILRPESAKPHPRSATLCDHT